MRSGRFLILALAATPFCSGVEICVEDRAKLSLPAFAALRTELSLTVPDARIARTSRRCSFRLEIRPESMPGRPDVLGRTPLAGGRILPRAEVFVPSIVNLLGGGLHSHEMLGRAIARVAAHEIGHYLSRSGNHQESGLMQPQFTASQLVRRP